MLTHNWQIIIAGNTPYPVIASLRSNPEKNKKKYAKLTIP
jgi:hypothetical protein